MTDIRAINGAITGTRTRRTLSKQAVRIILYAQLVILDCFAIFSGFSIAAIIGGASWMSPAGLDLLYLLVPLYALLAINRSAYTIDALGSLAESLRRSLTALFVTMLVILMFGFFFKAESLVARLPFAVGIATAGLFMTGARVGFYYYTRRRTGDELTDELLIIDGVDYVGRSHGTVVDARVESIEPDLHNPKMLSRLAS